MEDTTKASSAPTLADGPAATGVTFHGLDGSVTAWVDPHGHVSLSPALARAIHDGVAMRDRAVAAERVAS